MLIVHVTSTDPAGSVLNFANAINAHTKHRARVITTRQNPYAFPEDIGPLLDMGDELEALLTKADVIHLHKVFEQHSMEYAFPKASDKQGGEIKRSFCVADYIAKYPKKVLYHVHGHPDERGNPEHHAAEYAKRKARVLCSTPDLEVIYRKFYDGINYFPNCVPINNILYLPRETDSKIKIADGRELFCVMQSPTHSVLKNVHVIKSVTAELGAILPVFYLKVMGMDHEMALRHKRNAHVVFDHMEGYYGLSSLEGLSMGKPTIAGLSDDVISAICDFWNINAFELPWQIARNTQGLRIALSDLITMDEWRIHLGQRSREFMENIWSDKNVAERLAAIYESL